ncbi:MAG TPA: class III extradiol ring-cleavage dioxygenase [Trichocoleus sp.]|jgi:4,5-DOPA dioxygenase extradiol
MNSFPSVFISHGAPDLLLHPSRATDFFKQFESKFGRPEAILVISAHWLSQRPVVSAAVQPRTIHDFGGFPAELYEMQYSAPGAPALAAQVKQQLEKAGFPVEVNPDRGLDHGAWSPLLLMYPEANIPVTQLSIQPYSDPEHHLKLGRALAPLREAGVLILASGSITHNLQSFGGSKFDAESLEWAVQFDQWLAETIAQPNIEALLNYRQQAPYAVQNHPTDEHFLPLFVALGAGGTTPQVTQLHSSFTYGAISMAAYAFA